MHYMTHVTTLINYECVSLEYALLSFLLKKMFSDKRCTYNALWYLNVHFDGD